jgi:hypothetical protein
LKQQLQHLTKEAAGTARNLDRKKYNNNFSWNEN